MNDDGVLMWLVLGLGVVLAWLLIMGGRLLPYGQPLVWLGWGLGVCLGLVIAVVQVVTWRRGK